jgi:hypothetical protein
MYGSDSRYSKSIGLMNLTTNDRVQPDFLEISASVHIPISPTNGLDVKGGKYQDPMTAAGRRSTWERILHTQLYF